MALRLFGGSPADVTATASGAVIGGISLKVYTALNGGQRVTELYDTTGLPLPGVVTSGSTGDTTGRVTFQAADQYSILYMDAGYGERWAVPAQESFGLTDTAYARANRAIELAENAVTHDGLVEVLDDPARGPVVFPHLFGATGNGVSDDSAAVQAAIDYLHARGGGTLAYDPKIGAGVYRQNNVALCPNLIIEGNGATLQSISTTVFYGSSGNAKGYGAYTKNITIRDLTIRGNFDTNTQAKAWFHHTDGLLIENCTWIEGTGNGHCLDLGACRNVTIRSCRFIGYNPVRDHAEAIQIDHSTAAGMANADAEVTYDGLPCVNVTIEDCSFEQLVKNGVTYAAPTPLGNHVYVENLHENITFTRNTVVGAHMTSTRADANGWIHTYGVNGMEISHNRFEVPTGQEAPMIVIRINTRDRGVAPSDYGVPNSNSGNTNVTIRASSRVRIISNEFIGFAGDDAALPIILIEGRSGHPVTDLIIESNAFLDCYPEARKADGGSYSGDPISLAHASGVTIRGNTFRQVRRLLYAQYLANAVIESNTLIDAYWTLLSIGVACRNIIIRGNTIDGYVGSISLGETENSTISSNVLRGSRTATGLSAAWNAPIRINGGSRASVIGNVIESISPPASQAGQAVKFTGNHAGGLYGSNLYSGHAQEATVDSGSTVTAK